ncbi:MAG TPA: plastocyanin/azurin family copper-binding protein [Candidatus Limnocylindria bacterium]|nr:plastocyanin/azurin family copper-binding protein [Candidatus Limnocylindria bacterium]
MNRRRLFRWAVAMLLAAGCSAATVPRQDGNTPTRTPRAADRTPGAASPTGVAASATPDVDGTIVIMGDHFIDPQTVVVKAGTTVIWRNSSGQHDVTSRDGLFRSPTLGDSYSHTFMQPGTFKYFCSFHFAEMRGEVIVEPAN